MPDKRIAKLGQAFSNNCPINEETADGTSVGQCWFWLGEHGVCPRHGDVSTYLSIYRNTGRLTAERVMIAERRDSP